MFGTVLGFGTPVLVPVLDELVKYGFSTGGRATYIDPCKRETDLICQLLFEVCTWLRQLTEFLLEDGDLLLSQTRTTGCVDLFSVFTW